MQTQNIVIVGLTEVGQAFLAEMLKLKPQGVTILGVSPSADGQDLSAAEKASVNVVSIEQIVELGDKVDIIFDLSGDRNIRSELRKTLFSSQNQHTVIAPESIAQIMYKMITQQDLLKTGGKPGY
jgi:hypothetical protein